MPSKTIHFTDEQYAKLVTGKGEDQNMADRVREVVDMGLEVEQDE